VAQVRLQADELSELRDAMRLLSLTTMSEALREGIRLLTREAREVVAAEEIRRFYGGKSAPLPDGVASATEEELAAADSEQW
jgi:Arc/MetJ-type ribon-helix-helix transcriptional regulator